MAIVNFENVAAAAESLAAAGERPSVRAVMAKIGGGSPNSVLKLLAEWKTGRPVVRIADTELDTRITDAIKVQMQRVAETAAQAAEERAAGLDDDLQALAEAQAAAEQQVAALSAERDTARTQAADFVEQLEEVQADAERQQQHAAQALAAVRDELASERQRQELAAAALARAEVRLEALPGLQTNINELRQALHSTEQSKVQAERASAVLTARLEAAERRASEADARTEKAEARADASAKEATAAQTALQASQVRVEAEIKAAATAAAAAAAATADAAAARTEAKRSAQELADLKRLKPEQKDKPRAQGSLKI
jgi:colicin import membrane protein